VLYPRSGRCGISIKDMNLTLFQSWMITSDVTEAVIHSANPWQVWFQDPAAPNMLGIVNLHHDIMFLVVLITILTLWLIYRTLFFFDMESAHATTAFRQIYNLPDKTVHGTMLELGWTVAPTLILLMIALPSMALLYSIDEIVEPSLTIKIIGHQWYWSYEYSTDLTVDGEQLIEADEALLFDSYLKDESDLELGEMRLLEVDNRLVLPIQKHIRVIVTAADVLHCWAVPSLGVKLDACPGRLNQMAMFIPRPGIYYGNCSEICGSRHGYMPICVEAVSFEDYCSWLCNKYFDA
jgi:cytochrome c oxidase subunit 2